MDHTLHNPGDRKGSDSDNYTELVPPGSGWAPGDAARPGPDFRPFTDEEWEIFESLDVPTVGKDNPPTGDPSYTRKRVIPTIGTRRRCSDPKGLVLRDKNDPNRYETVVVGCHKCPECRAWLRELDRVRVTEAMAAPVWFVVADDRWEATRKRLSRHGLAYFQAPLPDNKRAVVCDRGYEGPAEPVADLAALLEHLDDRRPRDEGRAAARVSSSGLRSRADIEAEAKGEQPEEPPAEREVVGVWNTRNFRKSGLALSRAGEWLGAMCDSVGAAYEPTPLGVLVKAHKHTPEAARLWLALQVQWLESKQMWYEGGEVPTDLYWQAALGSGPSTTDPPIEVYDQWAPPTEEAA